MGGLGSRFKVYLLSISLRGLKGVPAPPCCAALDPGGGGVGGEGQGGGRGTRVYGGQTAGLFMIWSTVVQRKFFPAVRITI